MIVMASLQNNGHCKPPHHLMKMSVLDSQPPSMTARVLQLPPPSYLPIPISALMDVLHSITLLLPDDLFPPDADEACSPWPFTKQLPGSPGLLPKSVHDLVQITCRLCTGNPSCEMSGCWTGPEECRLAKMTEMGETGGREESLTLPRLWLGRNQAGNGVNWGGSSSKVLVRNGNWDCWDCSH